MGRSSHDLIRFRRKHTWGSWKECTSWPTE